MEEKIETSKYIDSFKKYPNNNLMVLLSFYKGEYFSFFLSTVFFFIKHSPVWLLPIVTADIINYISDGVADAKVKIIKLGILMAVLLVLNIPFNYLHNRFRSKPIRRVEAGLRSALVHKIQKLQIPFTKDMESGRLQSKIIRDVEAVETLSDQTFTGLMNILVNVVVALVVTLNRSLTVFFFFIIMVPLAAFLIYIFRSPIKKHNQRFRREMEKTSAEVMEMVELMPVTRAHALENEEIKKMDSQIKKVAKEGYSLDIIQANFGAVSWVAFQLFQVICLVFTAFLAIRKVIPVGDVVMYQSYFGNVVGQISSLLNLLPIIAKGLESVASIGEILNVNAVENYEGKEKIEDLSGEYEFDHVSFSYPNSEKPVVDDFNLKIMPKETIAFVGESGAGKSTIVNMLIGFLSPTEGKLLIDGKDIEDLDLHTYRENLAVVPQESILFSGTIRENILYGTSGVSEEKLHDVIEKAGLTKVIEKLPDGLETMVGERGEKLSGGQRQRISIARALIRNPKVIILDEATSALDSASEREVTATMENIAHSCTVFIVAHKLSTIKKADKIVVMHNGKIIETGTFDELSKNPKSYFRVALL